MPGLRMLDLEPEEISIDMDLHWIGNASCILGVSTIMGVSFPVQVLSSPLLDSVTIQLNCIMVWIGISILSAWKN